MNLKKARKNVEISAIPFVELSMFLLKYVNKTGVTPNQLTFMGLFFGVLASIFIGFNGYYSIFGLTMYWQGLLGAFFGLLFMEFDVLDGHLARSNNLCSKLGGWYDTIFGILTIQMVLAAVIISLGSASYLLGVFAISAYPMHFMFVYQFKCDFADQKKKKQSILNTRNYLLKYMYGQGIFYPLVFVAYLINMPIIILWFYATLGNLYWLMLLVLQYVSLKNEK